MIDVSAFIQKLRETLKDYANRGLMGIVVTLVVAAIVLFLALLTMLGVVVNNGGNVLK